MIDAPKLMLGAVSALGVALVVIRDSQRSTPGDLSAVHQRVEGLDSRQGCVQCHGEGEVQMLDACLECHEDVGANIKDGEGLHGSLDTNLAVQCAVCHSEHHGEDFPMVNKRSFFLAGVPDAAAFDHGAIGFEMGGTHLDLLCVDCHADASHPILPEGTQRYMGLDKSCASCHEDAHDGLMAKGCADCHTQESFADLSQFVHHERFPLIGSHAGLRCADCHADGTSTSIEAEGGASGPERWRECADCHESPHAESFIAGIALAEELSPGGSCVTCHALEHELFSSELADVTREQHALTGFPLEAPHDEVSCADCHGESIQGAQDFAARYPGRQPLDCQDCHGDAHEGFFVERAIDLNLPTRPRCAECHLPTTFSELPPQGFAHGHWTEFTLAGAHEQSECTQCHPLSEQADENGRRFGWVSDHFGALRGCATCHSDPHEGQFDVEGLPANIDGRFGCARCHNETSFRSFPNGFDHTLWTGFALDGAHAEQNCSTCHPPHRPDAVGRTWARANGTNCADCHSDSHGGQFDENGATECRRCHEDTSDFHNIDFNHNIDSSFPLDETHRDLNCNQCHRPVDFGETQIVRYKPMGRECIDCHGSTRSRVRSRGRGR